MGHVMKRGYNKIPVYSQMGILFDYCGVNDCRRDITEQFIHQVYSDKYDANITRFMPDLFGLFSKKGNLLAAVGMRSAIIDRLFLESYIDCPIETVITKLQPHHNCPVNRTDIVELGNLASVHPASARLIIIAMTMLLYNAGYEWVAFTAVPSLYNSFAKLGLNPLPLATAKKESLGANDQDDWGSYYESSPIVYAGKIADGYDCLIKSSLYPELLQFVTRWAEVPRKNRSMQLLPGKTIDIAIGN